MVTVLQQVTLGSLHLCKVDDIYLSYEVINFTFIKDTDEYLFFS